MSFFNGSLVFGALSRTATSEETFVGGEKLNVVSVNDLSLAAIILAVWMVYTFGTFMLFHRFCVKEPDLVDSHAETEHFKLMNKVIGVAVFLFVAFFGITDAAGHSLIGSMFVR